MRRLPFLAVAIAVCSACLEASSTDGFELDALYGAPDEFARGETLTDQSTVWNDVHGYALGSDEYGAFGMVGMVCSFAATDGFLRMDVDNSDGDEVVVDAISAAGGGFVTLAIDGQEATVAEFPSEWEGAVTAEVVFPGGAIETAAVTDTLILAARTTDEACELRSRERGGMLAEALWLDGVCASPLEADAAGGTAWIATTSGTFEVTPEREITRIGDPAAHLAHRPGWLLRGTAGGLVIARPDGGDDAWSVRLGEGPADGLVGLAWITGDRAVVALAHGELVVLDAEGQVLERIETTEGITSMTASPQGGMLAVRGPSALHLVRVLP